MHSASRSRGARPRARTDAGRDPSAMVARRAQWRADRRGGGKSGSGCADSRRSRASHLPVSRLLDLIEAHAFDLYDDPMPDVRRASGLFGRRRRRRFLNRAATICGGVAGDVAERAGVAYGITALLRAFALHASRRQLFIPLMFLAGGATTAETIFAGRTNVRSGRMASICRARSRASASRCLSRNAPRCRSRDASLFAGRTCARLSVAHGAARLRPVQVGC